MSDRKTAIITGASKGIGRQTAFAFAAAGYNTVVVATGDARLQQVKSEIDKNYGTACIVCYGDLADMSFVTGIAEHAMERFGRIDALVNNAAWRTIETMRTIDLDTWEKTLRVCLTAPAFLARSCAKSMEAAGKGGCIINVSSVMSNRAAGNSPAYLACKGAIESLTRELAVTYGRAGIRAVCVRPGYVETDLSKDYQSETGDNVSRNLVDEILDFTPAHRGGTPADIANGIVWLASEAAAFITGCELTMDGGLSSNFNSYSLKKLQFPTQY